MTPSTILVVDDEENIRNLVGAYLQAEGYQVRTAEDGPGALQAARTFQPDVIVLDIMLPGMDGLEILQTLRRESNVYVIMLTARSEETDKVVGLSLGADDYLTKPFSPRELVARVKAALRRMESIPDAAHALTFSHIKIDADARQVLLDGKPIDLTSTEFDLLLALAKHHGRVLNREQLIQQVWGYDFYGDDRVVDVHLGRVRKKIEPNPAHPRFIVTVRGVGYRFEDSHP